MVPIPYSVATRFLPLISEPLVSHHGLWYIFAAVLVYGTK